MSDNIDALPTEAKDSNMIKVNVGDQALDYSLGDFLNAIDAVVCAYDTFREQTNEEMACALELYAKRLRGDEV